VTNVILPDRVWICPWCHSQFVEGWRLKRHLILSHDLSETRARALAERSEYWLRVKRVLYVEEDPPEEKPTERRVGRRRRGTQ
jgi:hypothetical protein